jgi:PKD repeat protein
MKIKTQGVSILIIGFFVLSVNIGGSMPPASMVDHFAMDIPDKSPWIVMDAQGQLIHPENPAVNVFSDDYWIGEPIWQYTISASYDNSPKAIAPIPDVNNDGIDDVVICSEDDYVRCFDGSAIGTGIVLWEHAPSADVYLKKGLSITEDIDGDGYADVVFGTNGGTYTGRLIRTLSGDDGSVIWTHDTHEYGDGGWVYAVDTSFDYNNDDVLDVLAATGDDSTDTGPKRIYCLDGLTGVSIWERPLGGPGFEVVGVDDFTGDGVPDVIAGASNEQETIGFAHGINGASGSIDWTFQVPGTSVWAVEQLDDISGDGTKDIIIGDFYSTGNIYGLDPTDGSQLFHDVTSALLILHLEKTGDVNNDGYIDVIPSHTNHYATIIDGYTGNSIWTQGVADQAWNAARISDVSGDAIDDVLVGTLFNNNYCYFFDGSDGTELKAISYAEAVDAIAAVSDALGDGSMEMVAGGREGKVTCYSGGLNASSNPITLIANFSADPLAGGTPLTVDFTDLSVVENTTISSWKWDFNNDGIIDSINQDPSWTYASEGVYTVSLEISDGIRDDTEVKEDYITVVPTALNIGPPQGGFFKVTAAIHNSGETLLTNISWSINLEGGVILIGTETTGSIPLLDVDESTEISSGFIFGFGKTNILVYAESSEGVSDEREKSATILLFYIHVQPGGGI